MNRSCAPRVAIAATLVIVAMDPARGRAEQDREPPIITHVRVTRAPRGQSLVIRARIEDAGEVFAPAVFVRHAGGAQFVSLPMRKGVDAYEALIPAEQVTAPLEYFVEAFDELGNGPSREGGPETPIRIEVVEPAAASSEPPPLPAVVAPARDLRPDRSGTVASSERDGVLSAWWFWTLVGLAVTGGAAAALVAARSGRTVELVDVEVVGPDPTSRLP